MAPYLDLPTPPSEEEYEQAWLTKPHATSVTQADEEVIAIGGNNIWLFEPKTQLFDISRGSAHTLTISNTAAEQALHNHCGVKINPAKTCLVVVDMQNYFIHPAFHHHAAGLSAVEPILRVIEKCREEGIQVAWLNWVINDQDMLLMPPAVQRSFSAARALERGNGWGVNLGSAVPEHLGGNRVLWEGSWNSATYSPLRDAMTASDVICHKNRMSGMWHESEPLHRFLRGGDFQTLLFAGINTDQCLLSTMTDAHSSGFDVIMLKDCTGTATKLPGAQELVEYNIATCMGFVFDSDSLVGPQGQMQKLGIDRHDSSLDLVESG